MDWQHVRAFFLPFLSLFCTVYFCLIFHQMKILTIKNSTTLSMFKPFSAYLYCCWVYLWFQHMVAHDKIFNTVRKNSLLEKFLKNLWRCFEKTLFQKRSITGKQVRVIPKTYYSYGSSTITPEENCPQIISSKAIAPWMIAHQLSAARTIAPVENCPLPEISSSPWNFTQK